MALVLADRVQDTTTTTGTGTVTLANAPPAGFQSFGAAIGNGNTTYYVINGGSEYEVGVGTYTAAGTSLSRDTVLSSSNGGSLVNFSAGTKLVFVTYPAEKSVNKDVANNVNVSITGNAATATKATNLNDGTAGAIPYQSASNVTAFLASASGVLVGGNPPTFSTTPTLTGTNFTAIPNAALSNNAVTIGTTSVALGATSLTLAGLTSVTLTQDPTLALQAATKQYVDAQTAAGIHFHQPVRVESPINLTATYSNGTAGVGATLTNAGAQTALVIDGVTLSVADRVLIYQQTTQTQNGIYVVTSVGSGSTNWILTRASDANTYINASPNGLSEGSTVFVQQGTTGAGGTYTCNTPGTITFGTTAITFAQISSAQIYSAGTGLTLTGTQFSLTTPVATTLGGTGLTTFGATNRALFSSGTNTLTAGTLPVAAGGTGQTTYTDGQLLIGKTSDGSLAKATITAGTSISVTNGDGSITIANTAPDQTVSLTGSGTTTITGSYPNFNVASADQFVGTVTSVSASVDTTGTDIAVAVTSSTTTPAIALSIPTSSASARGALTSTDWSTFNAKQTALISGTNIKTINGTSVLGSGDLSTLSTPLAVVGNATAGAEIRLPEDTDNGSNYVALKAPDTLAANLTLTLPTADGTSGQLLQTNGSGQLSFVAAPAGAFTNVRFLISSTTFVAPTTGSYRVTAIGGGGSGGVARWSGSDTYGSGATGGGAGGLAIRVYNLVAGQSYTCTVGAGGASRNISFPGAIAGLAGGTSSFSGPGITTITANGGGGGNAVRDGFSVAGASGGTASGGQTNITGGGSGAVSNIGDIERRGATGGGAVGFLGVGYSSGSTTASLYSSETTGGAGVGGASGNATTGYSSTGGGGTGGPSSNNSFTGGAALFANTSLNFIITAFPILINGKGGDAGSISSAAPTTVFSSGLLSGVIAGAGSGSVGVLASAGNQTIPAGGAFAGGGAGSFRGNVDFNSYTGTAGAGGVGGGGGGGISSYSQENTGFGQQYSGAGGVGCIIIEW
jgi:hypothetical protein